MTTKEIKNERNENDLLAELIDFEFHEVELLKEVIDSELKKIELLRKASGSELQQKESKSEVECLGLERKLLKILQDLGIPSYIRGYTCLMLGIPKVMRDRDNYILVTK